MLEKRGVVIGTHLAQCAGVEDEPLAFGGEALARQLRALGAVAFPALSSVKAKAMQAAIEAAAAGGDSVGGMLETAVLGLPAGLGEPFFGSVESTLAGLLFSIPAVKGVEFGAGFGFAGMRGSCGNDSFRNENGRVVTATNNSGGINGGITNGMPVLFRCAVRPTPSIAKEQDTVSLEDGENSVIAVKGRHDPCIVHRAAAVVTACTAVALLDMLSGRYGTDLIGL